MIKAFVVGHPIVHSRSPMIHGHWLAEHGIPGSYERIDVAPGDFERFLRGFAEQGFAGGNVTLPHKEAAFRLVDQATDRAARLGAVNTLWIEDGRIHGDNTDVLGFAANLDQVLGEGWELAAAPALVMGAGGAARAVAAALLDRGLLEVMIHNRTESRAEQLRTLDPTRVSVLSDRELPQALAEAGLVVNTTSLGMAGQPALALDLGRLRPDAVVADIVYVPLDTPLLAAARARGLRTVDGLGMLLHQAVPGFARWFGQIPQVTQDLRAPIEADIRAKAG